MTNEELVQWVITHKHWVVMGGFGVALVLLVRWGVRAVKRAKQP